MFVASRSSLTAPVCRRPSFASCRLFNARNRFAPKQRQELQVVERSRRTSLVTSAFESHHPHHLYKDLEADVSKIAESVGARLTRNELALLRQKLDLDHGHSSIGEIQERLNKVGQAALQEKTTREVCLSVICSPANPLDKWGVKVINFFDYSGTALFAVVGTQVAGDSGMNMVGCCLVGCVAALGGGSLNALVYGGTTPLLGHRNGVRWVANPSFLMVAMAASVVTFFAWPYYCQTQANHYVDNVIGRHNLQDDGTVGKEAFLKAWQRHPQFRQTIRHALPPTPDDRNVLDNTDSKNAEGHYYFCKIDMDGSGDIDREELEKLVQRRFRNGWETYWLDTFALSALSIAAVSNAVKLGLHPLVAATSGVTVCFGGILRDLLSGRDLAIGSQSYAFATGASSFVYICLRELTVRRILTVPLVIRTFMAAGTCVSIRGWEFIRGQPLLSPMHGRSVDSTEATPSPANPLAHGNAQMKV